MVKNAKARKRPLKRSAPPEPEPAKRKLVGITEASAALFLAAIRDGFSLRVASERSGVARSTAYDLRAADKTFRKAWDDAVEAGTDRLEDEALRRALAGTERPIFQGGKHVGTERIYSDRMLEILLKARRPKKYREKVQHQHGGEDGGPIGIDIKGLSNEQLAAFKKRILAGAAGAAGDIGPGRRGNSGSD